MNNNRTHTLPLLLLAGTTLSVLAPSAHADVPAVLDRVPENAAIVITVENMESSFQKITMLSELFGGDLAANMEMGGESPLKHMEEFLNKPGINKSGSAAAFGMEKSKEERAAQKLVIKAANDDAPDDEPVKTKVIDGEGNEMEAEVQEHAAKGDTMDFYALLPVTDYAALVKSLGAKGDTTGVVSIQMPGEEGNGKNDVFARNIGNGYALVGDNKDKIVAMKLEGGKLAGHKAMLGTAGKNVADKCGVLLIANIAQLRDEIEEGLSAIDERNGPGAMQQMPGMAENIKQFEGLAKMFARDAQVGVVGMGASDKGLWFDLASQFKEGTEMAGYFTQKSNAGTLLAKLPQQPFLAAFAMDQSSPGMKKIMAAAQKMNEANMKNMAAMMGQDVKEGDAGKMTNPFGALTAMSDKIDGYAMVMGATPAGMMGGLFNNTMMYLKTSDPAGYMASYEDILKKTNGSQMMGINYKTSFQKDAKEIAGAKIDQWGMTMAPDPNNPMGQQVMMMQGMIFGPQMGGYSAKVDGGLLMSLSKNEPLMKMGLESLAGGKGMLADADIAMVREQLPADRTVEGYVGVKNVIDLGLGFMGMFMGAPDVTLPEKITPIGFAGSMHSGGAQIRVYMPNDAIAAFKEVGAGFQKMQGGMQVPDGEEPMNDGGDSEPPKF